MLDDDWFKNCKSLNKARNIAAHKWKMDEDKLFKEFGASSIEDFKTTLKKMIELIVFKQA